jgi:NACHT domain
MSKILILSSNPRGDLKNLNREIRDLKGAIQRLGKFEVEDCLAVRSQDIKRLIAENNPHIVHFCGHGAGEQGIVFEDEGGHEQLVSTDRLAEIFEIFSNKYEKEPVNCVVLNACDSYFQAKAIVRYIDYAIGMTQPILDKAAYRYSLGFYGGLAAGKTIKQAHMMGRSDIGQWSDETKSQSTQSRQYRKLEPVGDVGQPAQLELPECLKPEIFEKSVLFPSSLAGSGSVSEVSPLSAPSGPQQQEFVEYVKQEIDRKEYKDQARDAYDNFGQFSAQNAASLTKSEFEQRKLFLGKVKQFWIEGFLKPSLQGVVALSLDREDRLDAIADLSQGIEALSVELDASYERLRDTQIHEEIGQGRTLLILGSPGAGKTIALLQLAQRLIERSEEDPSIPIPMPVVFNLSSWAKDQKPIVDWLIDELREKYQVPKSLSEPWIKEQQLILLLDGLDEVKEERRNDCVRALNEFIGLFPQTEVAVCSRVRDYEALTERLQISSALCLQPLTSEQVYQFLDSVGGPLAGLKTLIKRDAELEQFAQTPLILNFMSVAYQGWSVEKLLPQLSSTTDRQKNLFDTYIDRRLEQGAASEYSKDQVLRWLSWLASCMVQETRTIFLIEKMQPTWLKDRSEEKIYRIRIFIVSCLIFGLIGSLIGVRLFELFEPIYRLTKELNLVKIENHLFLLGGGVVGGLSGGLIGGIITGLPKIISPLGKLSWSWKRASHRFMGEMFVGIIYGLIFGLILGLIFGLMLIMKQMDVLIFGLTLGLIFGLIGGLVLGLMSGLGSSVIDQRTISNQGIHSSWRNCLIVGGGLWLIVGLIDSFVFELIPRQISNNLINGLNFKLTDSLIFGILGGLIGGLIGGLKYGGAAVIQHFTLRQILYQKGRIPWNYAKFLDFASDRLLMKKIGGGYVFFHRMLLEHFAQMSPNESQS